MNVLHLRLLTWGTIAGSIASALLLAGGDWPGERTDRPAVRATSGSKATSAESRGAAPRRSAPTGPASAP